MVGLSNLAMAIHVYKCPAHGDYEHLTTITGDSLCPVCREQGAKQFTGAYYKPLSKDRDVDNMHPGDRQMLLDHKRYIESRSADVRSGALPIKIDGPEALRPVIR